MSMVYSVLGLSVSSPYPLSLLQPASEVSFQPQAEVAISFPPDWPRSRDFAFGNWQFDADANGFFLYQDNKPLVRYSPNRSLEVAECILHKRDTLVFLCKRILPAVTAELGALVLHGAAVVIDGRTIIFCAPSGRGKTTLLHALLDSGAAFLTDDVLAVWSNAIVHLGPTFFQRVENNASPGNFKQVVKPSRLWEHEAHLTDIVSLDDFGPYQLTRVTGSQALLTILSSLYFHAADDQSCPWSKQALEFFRDSKHYVRTGHAQRAMNRAADLSRQTRVWRFSFPRGIDSLHAVVQRFLNGLA